MGFLVSLLSRTISCGALTILERYTYAYCLKAVSWGMFLGVLQIHNASLGLLTMFAALLVGSFLWAFPLVVWLTPRKRIPKPV